MVTTFGTGHPRRIKDARGERRGWGPDGYFWGEEVPFDPFFFEDGHGWRTDVWLSGVWLVAI